MIEKKAALHLLVITFLSLCLQSCTHTYSPGCKSFVALKPDIHLKIALISDCHYYSPSLGTAGPAFNNFIRQDGKMLKESGAILEAAIQLIIKNRPDIAIIPGDLTNDGSEISHKEFAQYLNILDSAGIRVFVIPGNHDVLNPNSFRYNGTTRTQIGNITPSDFKEIYAKMGYIDAVSVDSNSLSYIAEPVEGFRILAIDASGNKNTFSTRNEGSISLPTRRWIHAQLEDAKTHNKLVFCAIHYPVMEHFSWQKVIFKKNWLKDYRSITHELISHKVEVTFSGHLHMQDVTRMKIDSNYSLYDIETGSLIIYPSPVRFCEISGKEFTINSGNINKIDYSLSDTGDFSNYSRIQLSQTLKNILTNGSLDNLKLTGFKKNELISQIVEAQIARFQGDPKPSKATSHYIIKLLLSRSFLNKKIGLYLKSIWKSEVPDDNSLKIKLNQH